MAGQSLLGSDRQIQVLCGCSDYGCIAIADFSAAVSEVSEQVGKKSASEELAAQIQAHGH
jgi:hypothetical protein